MPMWDESRDGEPMINPNARPVTRTWRAPEATPPDQDHAHDRRRPSRRVRAVDSAQHIPFLMETW